MLKNCNIQKKSDLFVSSSVRKKKVEERTANLNEIRQYFRTILSLNFYLVLISRISSRNLKERKLIASYSTK